MDTAIIAQNHATATGHTYQFEIVPSRYGAKWDRDVRLVGYTDRLGQPYCIATNVSLSEARELIAGLTLAPNQQNGASGAAPDQFTLTLTPEQDEDFLNALIGISPDLDLHLFLRAVAGGLWD